MEPGSASLLEEDKRKAEKEGQDAVDLAQTEEVANAFVDVGGADLLV